MTLRKAICAVGRIVSFEIISSTKFFYRIRCFGKLFILLYTTQIDISEAWEYTITDKFGNVLEQNEYTHY